jgi:hypothetical protein
MRATRWASASTTQAAVASRGRDRSRRRYGGSAWRDGPRSFATEGSSKAVARGPMDGFYGGARADFEEPRGEAL